MKSGILSPYSAPPGFFFKPRLTMRELENRYKAPGARNRALAPVCLSRMHPSYLSRKTVNRNPGRGTARRGRVGRIQRRRCTRAVEKRARRRGSGHAGKGKVSCRTRHSRSHHSHRDTATPLNCSSVNHILFCKCVQPNESETASDRVS